MEYDPTGDLFIDCNSCLTVHDCNSCTAACNKAREAATKVHGQSNRLEIFMKTCMRLVSPSIKLYREIRTRAEGEDQSFKPSP